VSPFKWLHHRKTPKAHLESCPNLNLTESDNLKHELRNAVCGIQRERLSLKRDLTLLMRCYLASYERTGEHLRRIEQSLMDKEG
jgi:hypothetical protein